MGPILHVENAQRTFGALRAVDGVSLELSPGDICGLVGPNGSGKSTLLNLISGVLSPTGGTINYRGEDVTGKPPHVVARLGMRRTFQLLRVLRGATVRENITAGTYVGAADSSLLNLVRRPGVVHQERTLTRAKVEEASSRLAISEDLDAVVESLPFGTQRKVELARAIVSEPTMLLLDEPAAGLGESNMRDLERLVRAESQRGAAVILVDHHLDFVLGLCDRVLVMNYGMLIFDGAPGDVKRDPDVREAYIGA